MKFIPKQAKIGEIEMSNEKETIKEFNEQETAAVSGGVYGVWSYPNEDGPEFDGKFRFKVGDHVEYITGVLPFNLHEFTDGGTVLHRSHDRYNAPVYQCSGINERDEWSWIDETRFQ